MFTLGLAGKPEHSLAFGHVLAREVVELGGHPDQVGAAVGPGAQQVGDDVDAANVMEYLEKPWKWTDERDAWAARRT